MCLKENREGTMADTFGNNNSRVHVRKQPSLTVNALSNWIALAVNVAIAFFLTPAILAHLGERRFGMWMLVSSVVGYFGLLRLGVGTGVFRYVPLFRGKGNQGQVNAVVSAGMAFYTIAGFVILITSFLCAGLIADFFQGGPELAILIRLFGLAAALECPSLIFDTAIRSYEGFVFANFVSMLGVILRAGALLGCIFMGYGLAPMGWTIVAVTFLALLAKGIAFKIYCPDVGLGIKKISFSVLKLLVLYGLIIMVESAGALLEFQSPKLIIGKTVSLEAVGFFAVVALLVRYYRVLILALTRVLMPRFSYLSGQNADEEILRLFLRGSKYVTIVTGVIALLLLSVGSSFISLWIQNDNIKQVIPAFTILTAGMLIFTSHQISGFLLYGMGKQKYLAMFAMIEGVSVCGLSLALSSRYGVTGVAVGASVPLILVRGLAQTVYVCRLANIGFLEYYAGCMLKPWTIAIALAIASYWLGVVNFAHTWVSLFLISGLIMVAYGAVVYATVIESEDKKRIKGLIFAGFSKLANSRDCRE